MEEEHRFIQFGCWNNQNKNNCLDEVMRLLTHFVETKPTEFVVVAGDNYYPDKNKDKKTDTKQKVIYQEKLEAGFNMLPKDIPIFMILGNHDLESNINDQNDNLYLENLEQLENANCQILDFEYSMLNKINNLSYDFFRANVFGSNTLILMIDTSIYEVDDPTSSYLKCYKRFFELSNQASVSADFLSIEDIRNYQRGLIINAIDSYRAQYELTNVIIIGHHPIVQFKMKKDKAKCKTDIPLFKNILYEIVDMIGADVGYYYLCADLHLYQEGILHFTTTNGVPCVINQYIVGTGGTALDDPLPSGKTYEETEDGITYALKYENANCGFLEVSSISGQLRFDPHFVPSIGGSRGRRRRTRRYMRYSNRRRTNRRR